jgi:hypothetical protein
MPALQHIQFKPNRLALAALSTPAHSYLPAAGRQTARSGPWSFVVREAAMVALPKMNVHALQL